MAFISGGEIVVACRPPAGFLRVASNLRVADGRKKPLIKRSLSDMQIARFSSSKSTTKMRVPNFRLLSFRDAWADRKFREQEHLSIRLGPFY
jgi:hypothetical protein